MLLLLFSSLFTISSCLSRQYYFVNNRTTWTEAQAYCRQYYTDLATLENANDTSSLTAAVNSSYNNLAWIGLYDDVENSWRWFYDNESFYGPGERDYRNFRKAPGNLLLNEPNNYGGNEMCTQMITYGEWNDIPCLGLSSFICYNKTNVNSYVKIDRLLNASDARQYCRRNHTDLASIRNATENQQILTLTAGQVVWIGLYRTRLWSDQSNSTYENWLTGQPDNLNYVEHCTAASLGNSGQWTDENCNQTLPFFCYRDSSRLPTQENVIGLRVRFTSVRNLTDSEIENVVLQQLQMQLINKGLPSNMKMKLKNVRKKNL
ncbi:macrophage mannose receptor 1-like [Pygocentrus nattereri]|uniref:macrophage mannose receptor 1-like n=1 Tax=Pygocentrus nattereri TaxID=42514 RepID=UPI000814875D|nr:macrophage mannose receptor 1-like [Pygocentrus nattereri]